MYQYKIMRYDTYYDELRGILGVTPQELPDAEIDLLPVLPAADLEVSRLVPTFQDIMSAAQDSLADLRLAVLYLGVANVLPSLKVRLLAVEDDGKTKGQRFADALALKPEAVRLQGLKHVDNITKTSMSGFPLVFEVVQPAVDPITGA